MALRNKGRERGLEEYMKEWAQEANMDNVVFEWDSCRLISDVTRYASCSVG
jgi:hypothetical protein